MLNRTFASRFPHFLSGIGMFFSGNSPFCRPSDFSFCTKKAGFLSNRNPPFRQLKKFHETPILITLLFCG